MEKKYKEFILNILAKTYQIVLGIAIVTPLVSKRFDLAIFFPSFIAILVIILWARAVSSRMEE